jgi:hypothetical protein
MPTIKKCTTCQLNIHPLLRNWIDEFDKNVQIAMQRRDRSQMDGVKAKIKQVIPPIRKQVVAEEKVLNDAMAMLLTEKQNVKWLKYQSQKKGNYK